MKIKILFISFLLLGISEMIAQNGSSNIIEELTRAESSEGTVTVVSDTEITNLLGKPNIIDANSTENVVKMSGYRIQAFSGSQKNSKEEAFAKQREIKSVFSDISTHVTYKAPVWRLRVGDFQTKEDAVAFMRNLKKMFPSFGKEMYVVSDEVKVVLY